ncbi:hypothetical protein GGQ71_004902 [Rhizobium taibaishanense]|uniref:Uncharacterized protein n=1 Tax=Allorhizobium taibaishanense TaxID=887144 RepID=A0A7W6HSH9_9HYPH|nr:hypothetical protein [Allorhizobium taibaishanense]
MAFKLVVPFRNEIMLYSLAKKPCSQNSLRLFE